MLQKTLKPEIRPVGIDFCIVSFGGYKLLQAVSYFWNPITGGNGTWDTTSTMWKNAWTARPDTVWNNSQCHNDDATFRGGVTGNITVDAGGINIHNIFIGATGETTANNYTFSGGQLTFNGTAPNVIAITNATDTATINSAISASSLFFNNNFGSGSGSTITGNGNLILTGNNTLLSGTINVGGYSAGSGALRITNASAIGTATDPRRRSKLHRSIRARRHRR